MLENWEGDFFLTGGTISTQSEDCPGPAGGGESKCNVTWSVTGAHARTSAFAAIPWYKLNSVCVCVRVCVGGSKTNVALLVAQPWDYPVTFDLSKAPAATLTQLGLRSPSPPPSPVSLFVCFICVCVRARARVRVYF